MEITDLGWPWYDSDSNLVAFLKALEVTTSDQFIQWSHGLIQVQTFKILGAMVQSLGMVAWGANKVCSDFQAVELRTFLIRVWAWLQNVAKVNTSMLLLSCLSFTLAWNLINLVFLVVSVFFHCKQKEKHFICSMTDQGDGLWHDDVGTI